MMNPQIAKVRKELTLPTHPRSRRRNAPRRLGIVAMLAAFIATAWIAEAQPPYRQELLPGLAGFHFRLYSKPALADLDGDGDLDIVIGEGYGSLNYLKNSGSSVAPAFVEVTGTANPFFGLSVGQYSAPALADLDDDGDLDAVVGDHLFGIIRYFANTGSPTNPAFMAVAGTANPFMSFDFGMLNPPAPSLGDLDGDSDLDVVVGEVFGTLSYLVNTGSPVAPAYIEAMGTANPFSGFDVGEKCVPALEDLDSDGDLDLVVGTGYETLNYFINTGSSIAPAYMEATGVANPFFGLDGEVRNAPTLGDLDGDGDFDAVVGNASGTAVYFINTGSLTLPIFIAPAPTANPLLGIDVGFYSKVALADFDGDGDADAVIGEFDGRLNYLRNTGGSTAPSFIEVTGTANPFINIDDGDSTAPAVADLDDDGDLDAVIGVHSGTLRYLINTGSAAAPAYSEITGTANPFSGIDVGYGATPALADLDGDGDRDIVIGESTGTLRYFRNVGSSATPAFAEATGTTNPFAGFDAGFGSAPALVDLDRDGDLDTVVGELLGRLRYLRNTGSSTAPAFAELISTANPFAGLGVGRRSAPALADLDSDGDDDAVIGNGGGAAMFLRSLDVIFHDGFETGNTSAWSQTVP